MLRIPLLRLILVFPLDALCTPAAHADELSTITIIAADPAAS